MLRQYVSGLGQAAELIPPASVTESPQGNDSLITIKEGEYAALRWREMMA